MYGQWNPDTKAREYHTDSKEEFEEVNRYLETLEKVTSLTYDVAMQMESYCKNTIATVGRVPSEHEYNRAQQTMNNINTYQLAVRGFERTLKENFGWNDVVLQAFTMDVLTDAIGISWSID